METFIKYYLICVLIIFCSTTRSFAAFSGTYTINPNQAASQTNYQNITSASNDLQGLSRTDGGKANGKGVTGSVIFKIADGTYNESIFMESVSGISASSPIVFQSLSGSNDDVIIKYNQPSGYFNDYILEIYKCSYITFTGITFNGSGLQMDNVTVNQCHDIEFSNIVASSVDSVSQSVSLIYFMDQGVNSRIKILNSSLFNCTHPIMFQDNNIAPNNITISGNLIMYTGKAYTLSIDAIYTVNVDTFTITNNKIFISSEGDEIEGIELVGCIGPILIKGNEIILKDFSSSAYGMRIDNCSSVFIADNMISVSHCTNYYVPPYAIGINIDNNASVIVYNTVLIDSITISPYLSNSSHCLPMSIGFSSNFSTHIYNNNLVNRVGHFAMEFSGTATSSDSSDNNNLVAVDSLITWDGIAKYSTLNSYQAATGFDKHSVSIPQSFESISDLHNATYTLYGLAKPLTIVTDDIDGIIRDKTAPYIGASESFYEYDLATINVKPTKTSFCVNEIISLNCIFLNKGTQSVSNFNIQVDILGPNNSQINGTSTASVGHEVTDTELISSNLSFSSPGSYTIKVFHELSGDQYHPNDTFLITVNVVAHTSPAFTNNVPCVNSPARFTNTTSNTDNKTTYFWNFGDGIYSTLPSPTHAFSSYKTYKVLLTATEANACSDTTSVFLTPHPLPNAGFTYTTDLYAVAFSPVDPTAKSYTWKFGDGSTSNIVNPFHSYIVYDNTVFKATLLATSQYGCLDSTSNNVYLSQLGIANSQGSEINFSLYPNPFSDQTNIQYELNSKGHISLTICNMQGKVEAELINESQVPGKYNYTLNPTSIGLVPGVYYLSIINDGNLSTKKLIILK